MRAVPFAQLSVLLVAATGLLILLLQQLGGIVVGLCVVRWPVEGHFFVFNFLGHLGRAVAKLFEPFRFFLRVAVLLERVLSLPHLFLPSGGKLHLLLGSHLSVPVGKPVAA